MKQYYAYILASISKRLYTGVTNHLERRVYQHKQLKIEGFTKRYHITRLIHVEVFGNIDDPIRREQEIKGWRREKKINLIESTNPLWKDLSTEWFGTKHSS